MPQFMRWRLRGGRTTGDLGDMELGRRGVVFDNRVIFDVSGTSFDNLTFGNQPRVYIVNRFQFLRLTAARLSADNTVWAEFRLEVWGLGIWLSPEC